MWIKSVCLFATIAGCLGQRGGPYKVPDAKLEAIYPKGLRVSVPDDGYSLFAFHGKLNEEMEGLEAGHWSRDITKAKQGRWIFRDRNAELKLGDKIYFWTYVIKDGLGYRQDNGEWTVTEFVNENGTVVDTSTAPPPVAPAVSEEDQSPGPQWRPCERSLTESLARERVCKGSLVFSEDFDGSSLADLGNWTAEVRFPGEPDYPYNLYTTDGTVGFESGSLVVRPVMTESKYHEGIIYDRLDLERCTGQLGTLECRRESSGGQIVPPVMTAKLATRRSFAFKFGRIDIKAKMPRGDWLIPELNLEPLDNIYGNQRYASGLMRVAFVRGNDVYAKKLYGGPIMSDADPFRSMLLKDKQGLANWNNDYHVYSLLWKPNGLELMVDGEVYGTIDAGDGFYQIAKNNLVSHASQWLKGTVMAPFDEKFFITLGLRVAGIHDFTDGPGKPWENKGTKAMINFWNNRFRWFPTWHDTSLKVDYVRVYAL
uniref:Beta-1,3-glucan-binding protein 2 n=2 Tax=Manduca sexta TaxID=7130 RepID=BGBP2_MANSE|nr:RecName: Full=Beta-1,3-glucan-binding protein 2; Short=BGBP-2; AltName: Full=Beta-1,3-glucan recognition protein 2; Short=BetaGRP-2; Flags: Precursor [Manduca sexta]AAN10151.1 beta-1,3-glucan recognition protein 2 [Manduca sexta]